MITDFTDFNGKPILPGCTVVVAVETKMRPRLQLRKGKVYRVSLKSIGVDVEPGPNDRWKSSRSFRTPKRMIVVG